MTTSGKRNRRAGHNWERELAESFRKLGFPHVVTSRSESRSRDDQKVDLINRDERKNGQFIFNVQAKNATKHLKYAKLLAELPTEPGIINLIAHKQTERGSTYFVPTGKYVMLTLDDFLKLVKFIQTKPGEFNPQTINSIEL